MSSAPIAERNQDATVYVGGLDEKVSEAILWELFLQAGPVVNVHMPKDRVTQAHQGYGFVEFMGEEDADYAIKIMNMIKLYGKPIRVNKASAHQKNLDIGANIFIGNLDPEVDEKLLYDTFSAFGVILQTPKIMRDPDTGNSKGYAFISFASFEASDAAIEAMNGQYLCNRPITISYAFKKDSKGERHGSAAERLLAAQNPLSLTDRPHQLFADAPPPPVQPPGPPTQTSLVPPPPPPSNAGACPSAWHAPSSSARSHDVGVCTGAPSGAPPCTVQRAPSPHAPGHHAPRFQRASGDEAASTRFSWPVRCPPGTPWAPTVFDAQQFGSQLHAQPDVRSRSQPSPHDAATSGHGAAWRLGHGGTRGAAPTSPRHATPTPWLEGASTAQHAGLSGSQHASRNARNAPATGHAGADAPRDEAAPSRHEAPASRAPWPPARPPRASRASPGASQTSTGGATWTPWRAPPTAKILMWWMGTGGLGAWGWVFFHFCLEVWVENVEGFCVWMRGVGLLKGLTSSPA
ncbi:uncharacterized protein LOC143302074 isoform X2 [Babylonia areolata]|uniref:uncharacterized protein LOC143302074 isoform X2 n=1 Tax=Babylonia areolata TaxID=304850 RepID=UPI003FD2BE5F